MNFEKYKKMTPMKYYDNPSPASLNLQQKRLDIINNTSGDYIASEKWDGEWAMLIRGVGDEVLIRSRSISKKTGEYGDKTAHLPHIVSQMLESLPENTVLLGEVCWGEHGTVSTDVGRILRCLPDKAVARQTDKKLMVRVFDCLVWDDQELLNQGYGYRAGFLGGVLRETPNIMRTTFYGAETDFATLAAQIIEQGGEGIVIQRSDYPYEAGKRTAWKTLKVKPKTEELELVVKKTLIPTYEYKGAQDSSTWQYKDKDGVAITKAAYHGWKSGVVVDFNGTLCGVTSGMTDADREWLATAEAQELIDNGQLFAVVKAMMVNTLGSLRHPQLIRLRTEVL